MSSNIIIAIIFIFVIKQDNKIDSIWHNLPYNFININSN